MNQLLLGGIGKHTFDHGSGLGFELTFSITMTALIANAVLIVRLKYGDMEITHNTKRPYLLSMYLLLFFLIEVIVYLLIGNVFFKESYPSFEKYY